MVSNPHSHCPLADGKPGKKHGAQRIDRTWVPVTQFSGSLQISMYVPANTTRAEARTGDASSSDTRQQQSHQNREVAELTGDKRTPQLHDDNDFPSSRDTAAESHKLGPSESNQNVPAQITKEFIDLTGNRATTTRITEDDWRKRIGLPAIKRTEVDLTKGADKRDSFKES